jgi:hypothetical protein
MISLDPIEVYLGEGFSSKYSTWELKNRRRPEANGITVEI